MTALHLASKAGHIRVIQALKGALDWKSCSRKNGLTALHVAASGGQMECVSELLTQIPAGIRSERPLADPNADVSQKCFTTHLTSSLTGCTPDQPLTSTNLD